MADAIKLDSRSRALAETRRDFLAVTAGSFAAIGSAAALWPFIGSLNPSADVQALSNVEVDLAPIELGERITIRWRGRPVFIYHRTPESIARARADDDNPRLIDPVADALRVKREEWLIVVGVCTHLGCVPLGQRPSDPKSRFGGWFCPCHGSIYDLSGRVRRGPAPRNLEVPKYEFISESKIRIG